MGIVEKRKKLKSALMLAIFGLSLLVVIYAVPSESNAADAQSPTASYYGLNGYAGNETVYMTSYINNFEEYFLPEIHSLVNKSASGQLSGWQGGGMEFPESGVALSVGGSVSDVTGTFPSEYYFDPGSQMLFVYYAVSISAAAEYNYFFQGRNLTENLAWYELSQPSSIFLKAHNTGQALGTSDNQMDENLLNGLNVSFQNPVSTSGQTSGDLDLAFALGMIALGFVPVLGFQIALAAISTAGALYPYFEYTNPDNDPNIVTHFIGDKSFIDSPIANQADESDYTLDYTNGTAGLDGYNQTQIGQDPMETEFYGETKIPLGNFSQTGSIDISAGINQTFQSDYVGGIVGNVNSEGANTSISIPTVPAYTIQGTVKGTDGNPAPNTLVEIYDNTNGTAFYIGSDSSGAYRFFANPSHSYQVYLAPQFPNPAVFEFNVNPEGNTGGMSQDIPDSQGSTVMGYVKQQNGAPEQSKPVKISLNGYSEQVETNNYGFYQTTVYSTGDYEVSFTDLYGTVYSSVNVAAYNSVYWHNVTVASYSGGGCVLYGTEITLADGLTIPVQNLSVGMHVLSYNTNNNEFYRTQIEQIQVSNVSTVVNIDGLISLSGLNDQPVYVELSNGTQEWLVLGAMNTTMSVYDPLNDTWVPVYSYALIPGNFTVYEIITKNGFYIDNHSLHVFDYIANGFLVDRKIG